MGIIDNSFGGLATIALGAAPVILSSGQYQCAFIRFTGAITADIEVQFPDVGSFYSILNDTTNSSNFTVFVQPPGGQQLGIPPGTVTQILTDGSGGARFLSLPPVGTLWDYGGTSVPLWVSACDVPPYLYCNGDTFNSADFPALAAVLGGTTLPDLRGRYRANFNDGTGRLLDAVDGDTNLASGGDDGFSIDQSNIPNYDLSVNVNDPGHVHTEKVNSGSGGQTSVVPTTAGSNSPVNSAITTASATTGITVDVNSNGGGNPISYLPPTQIVGITMIRAG